MYRFLGETVIICCCVIGSGCGAPTRNNTAAILEVYRKIDESNAKLKLEERQEGDKWWQMGTPGVWRRHFERLSSIDGSRCPPEFRQAFDAYLYAMKDWTQAAESVQGWTAWAANFTTLGGATAIPALLRRNELIKRVEDAQFKMKRIAMQYGLSFKTGE